MSMIKQDGGSFLYAPPEDVSFKLEAVDVRKKTNRSDWELSLQFLNRYMMLVVASGHGALTVDGQFIELREGGIYFWAPGQLVEGALRHMDERGFFALSFRVIDHRRSEEETREGEKRDALFPLNGEILAMSPISISVLCERIQEHLDSSEALERFRAQIFFQELLYRVFSEAMPAQEKGTEAALDHVKAYMERNYQQELTIDQLAKVAGISGRHFMRLFKKRFGCSAIDYLTIFRIGQAQQLMRMGGPYRLKDIARHVGYHDDAYFRRKFKQISGIPPAAFMKNSRLNIAAYHPSVIWHLLALRAAPCAAPAENPWTDYYQRKFGADRVLALSGESARRLEELQKLAPDFIIASASEVSAEEEAALSAIAPTFLVAARQRDWRSQFKQLAAFLDKMAEAEAWLARYERKAAFIRAQLRGTMSSERLMLLKLTGAGLETIGLRGVGTVFYEDLNLTAASGPGEDDRPITLQQLAEMPIDRILMFADEARSDASAGQGLNVSEGWRSLPAVREGRATIIPAYLWLEHNAFTNEMLLDEVWKLWQDRA